MADSHDAALADAEALLARRYGHPLPHPPGGAPGCACARPLSLLSHRAPPPPPPISRPSLNPPSLQNSRALSARVATFSQRSTVEGDALGEEVRTLRAAVTKARAKAAAAEAAAAADGDGGAASAATAADPPSSAPSVSGDGGGYGGLGTPSAAAAAARRGPDAVPATGRVLATATAVLEGHGPGGDLRKLLPRRPPAFLAALLGPSVNVVTLQRARAVALKEEYHAFRDRGGVILTASACALLAGLHRAAARAAEQASLTLTPPLMVGVQLMLAWLLYFYVALAARENVLALNGSAIRPWWIAHHYWSAAAALLVLALPVDSPAVQVYVVKLLWWSAAQGGVMMLQNRYQRRRMYTRIALGRARAMDVVSGESSGAAGQLLILYPLLFGLQAAQVAIGLDMVAATAGALLSPEGWLDPEAPDSDLRGSRGVALAGALMVYMGSANAANTVGTILDKRATRRARVVRGRARSAGSEGGGGGEWGGSGAAAAGEPAAAAVPGGRAEVLMGWG